MSLFQNLLDSINAKGSQIVAGLGNRTSELNNAAIDGPFDRRDRPDDDICNLAQSIVTDCEQLISLLVPSRIQLLQHAFAGALPAAMAVVAHFKVADVIEELNGRATVAEIAQMVDTDATKLGNILRTLTAHHVFVELEDGYFANNRQSQELLSNGGGAAMIESYAQVSGKALTGLLPLMTDKQMMHKTDPRQGAFGKAYGAPMSIFDWMMASENKDDLMTLMAGIPWLTQTSARETVENFNWGRWGKNMRVCDMGCADGGIMGHLKIKEPSFRIICQDLAPMLPRTRAMLASMVPAALEAGEIEVKAQDYFLEQQTPADIYWMRGVLHDYSDEDCVKILQCLKPRLLDTPKARLLVNEIVVPLFPTIRGAENRPMSEFKPEKQSSFLEMSSMMQLHSVAFQGGYERSYQEFENIFRRAGYQVVQFHQIQMFTAVMEVVVPGN